MNVDAAIENACGIYNRQANELWFAIPCNGATINNCIVVYDTIVKSWTKYDGIFPSSLTYARGRLGSFSPYYGV